MKKNWNDVFIVPLAVMVVLMLGGSVIGSLIVNLASLALGERMDDFWAVFLEYFVNIGIWIVTLLYISLVKKNRPILKSLWISEKGNTVKMFISGLAGGLIMNLTAIAIAYFHGDIHLYFDSFDILKLLAILFAVFIQSSAEELLCRGFLYQRLRMGYKNPWIAILGNSVLFASLHLLNKGMTPLSFLNIVIAGISFSLVVYCFDSIWAAMANDEKLESHKLRKTVYKVLAYLSVITLAAMIDGAITAFSWNLGSFVAGFISIVELTSLVENFGRITHHDVFEQLKEALGRHREKKYGRHVSKSETTEHCEVGGILPSDYPHRPSDSIRNSGDQEREDY